MDNKAASRNKRRQVILGAAIVGGSAYWLKTHKEARAQATNAGQNGKTAQNSAEQRSRYGIVGQPAPEISLDYWIDADGAPAQFSVMENRGKWVFLKCFQNWCPGCHSSGFPTLQKFSEAFANHPKVAIAGIQTVFEGYSHNTVDDVRKLQLKYDLPIIMGHDPGNEAQRTRPQTMSKYRTGGTPWLILIAPNGQVVFNDFHVKTAGLIDYVRKQIA